jgi:hypothetical protein
MREKRKSNVFGGRCFDLCLLFSIGFGACGLWFSDVCHLVEAESETRKESCRDGRNMRW